MSGEVLCPRCERNDVRAGEEGLGQSLSRMTRNDGTRNPKHDGQWWNWCRLPSAASGSADPTTVAVIPTVASHLSRWLRREIESETAGVRASEAAIAAL
jgi:hypothetical protein